MPNLRVKTSKAPREPQGLPYGSLGVWTDVAGNSHLYFGDSHDKAQRVLQINDSWLTNYTNSIPRIWHEEDSLLNWGATQEAALEEYTSTTFELDTVKNNQNKYPDYVRSSATPQLRLLSGVVTQNDGQGNQSGSIKYYLALENIVQESIFKYGVAQIFDEIANLVKDSKITGAATSFYQNIDSLDNTNNAATFGNERYLLVFIYALYCILNMNGNEKSTQFKITKGNLLISEGDWT